MLLLSGTSLLLTPPADWALLLEPALGVNSLAPPSGHSTPMPTFSPWAAEAGAPASTEGGARSGVLGGASAASASPNPSRAAGFVGPLGCSHPPRTHLPAAAASAPLESGLPSYGVPCNGTQGARSPEAGGRGLPDVVGWGYLLDVGAYLGRTAQPPAQHPAAAAAAAAAPAVELSDATLHTLAPPSLVARLARSGALAAPACPTPCSSAPCSPATPCS